MPDLKLPTLRLRSIAPARKLSLVLFEQLAEQIRGGRLAPGARLPTEQALTEAAGVSRTVVREAVAALRAEGLVTQKRGLDYDIRKDIYTQTKSMNLASVNDFFNQHVKGKKYIYLVLGSKTDVDMKALQTLGPVRELSMKELFGY